MPLSCFVSKLQKEFALIVLLLCVLHRAMTANSLGQRIYPSKQIRRSIINFITVLNVTVMVCRLGRKENSSLNKSPEAKGGKMRQNEAKRGKRRAPVLFLRAKPKDFVDKNALSWLPLIRENDASRQ